MIYTLTLNPAVDYHINISGELMFDEVNRGFGELYRVGGKGLNVSRVLSIFGVKSRAIALLGGFTGDYIRDQFDRDGNIEVLPVPVDGCNRINLKAAYGDRAICINGTGPYVSSDARARVIGLLGDVRDGDTVVISGSMMRGLEESFLAEAADTVRGRRAALVMDMETSGPDVLKRCRPDLIKPNLYELGLLTGREIMGTDDECNAIDMLLGEGIGAVLLSLGKDGAVYADGEVRMRLRHPDTVLINKTGAGDAMLAAFLAKREKGSSIEEALRYGGAAGNAAASGFGDINLEDITEMIPVMEIIGS